MSSTGSGKNFIQGNAESQLKGTCVCKGTRRLYLHLVRQVRGCFGGHLGGKERRWFSL